MERHRWDPICDRPADLVRPVRLDPQGRAGPTRGQARGRAWRQSAHGWYVPADVDGEVVEQRILEQAVRLPPAGAVTSWASLRWRGATFFDGRADGGRTILPVPIRPGGVGNLRRDPRALVEREQLAPAERELVGGISCTTVARATFDEMRRVGRVRQAVIVLDMASAAGLVTVGEMSDYVETRYAWTGVPLVRKALPLASDHSRSPQEVRMRLVWCVDAGLPVVECNRAVFDRNGRLLGYPDLLDPVAGVVGEYDGADHLSAERRRADVVREERFRDHGLEYFTVVGADFADRTQLVDRMIRTRARARFASPSDRLWTLDPPPGWTGSLHR